LAAHYRVTSEKLNREERGHCNTEREKKREEARVQALK